MPPELVSALTSGGPWVIIAAFVYAIMRGHLVPKSTLDEVRKDRDARLAEFGQVIDIWRNAALLKDETLKELTPVVEELVENDKLILKLLTAIREVTDSLPGGGKT